MIENNITRALRTVNYKLLAAIYAMMLLPTIYQTVRVFFLGNLPSDWGFNIASQLSWVGLGYEVIQEALILPLFFLLGKSLSNKNELENKIRTGLIVTVFVYFVFAIVLALFARPLVVFMAQDTHLIGQTIDYIRLETIAALFSILWRFLMVVFVMLGQNRYMYLLLVVQTILSILLDSFLVSNFPVSVQMGVNGIAVTNIIVNVLLLTVSISLLKQKGLLILKKSKLSYSWLKEWLSVGMFSGVETFVRNCVFMLMIIRMVNIIAEQGNYWIANTFIWQWLLLPSLALADLVKKEVGENHENIRKKTFGYLVLACFLAAFWLLTIPVWKPFLQYVMNVKEYETVFNIVLVQIGFYLTFIFNNSILDSTFYGVGKTKYMLIQSICINIFYYGGMFILYLNGIFVPSLLSISLMFGVGMALDCIPTFMLYKRLLRKMNLNIDFNLG